MNIFVSGIKCSFDRSHINRRFTLLIFQWKFNFGFVIYSCVFLHFLIFIPSASSSNKCECVLFFFVLIFSFCFVIRFMLFCMRFTYSGKKKWEICELKYVMKWTIRPFIWIINYCFLFHFLCVFFSSFFYSF